MNLSHNPYREDFPLLLNNPNVKYLDNAATSQRPWSVLKAEEEFYKTCNSNPLRGLYGLSMEATDRVENARKTVQKFLNAKKSSEIIFTRNTTESLNLVAYSYGLSFVKEGDEIVVSILEHHSNLLPWQMVAKAKKATLKFLYCENDGSITEEMIQKTITEKTKIVAIAHVSNVIGRENPMNSIIKRAHRYGAIIVVDAAQSAPHKSIDVQKLDVDFLAFSGHKMLAPMGIGVLYGKEELLEKMPPFLTGGEMIESVTQTSAKFAELPYKFEAGTGNAGGAIALAEAIRYMEDKGFSNLQKWEDALTEYALSKMNQIEGIHILGSKNPEEHCGILTFTLDDVHPHDIASILDFDQIAVRAGHHCAQPLMDYLKVSSTTRASLSFYNTKEEIDALVESLSKVRSKMGYGQSNTL
ncbi:MAG TPA: cysteine desulfurase [Candidatus Scybalomonas excrementigallinarum]|nr:cysteine desulfurase [Candidatus Scybalomonas excrementigallinarum]